MNKFIIYTIIPFIIFIKDFESVFLFDLASLSNFLTLHKHRGVFDAAREQNSILPITERFSRHPKSELRETFRFSDFKSADLNPKSLSKAKQHSRASSTGFSRKE